MTLVNEGSADRVLRIVVGLGLLALGWTGVVAGTPGLIAKWLGFLPLATGLIGWCPAYTLFGISSCKR
jgi:hypothetical protein